MLLAATFLLCPIAGIAQRPALVSGSIVFIEPSNGFETVLAAAFVKKKVPLVMVMDREKADFIIKDVLSSTVPQQPQVVVNNTNINGEGHAHHGGFADALARMGSNTVSISVVDVHTSQVVFADSVDNRQVQNDAEACAQHLREAIEKPRK